MLTIGYTNYIVGLLVITGALILSLDVKAYAQKNMKKEKKAALGIGWFNISLGIIIFAFSWVTKKWLW